MKRKSTGKAANTKTSTQKPAGKPKASRRGQRKTFNDLIREHKDLVDEHVKKVTDRNKQFEARQKQQEQESGFVAGKENASVWDEIIYNLEETNRIMAETQQSTFRWETERLIKKLREQGSHNLADQLESFLCQGTNAPEVPRTAKDICRTCLFRNECSSQFKDRNVSSLLVENCNGFILSERINEIYMGGGRAIPKEWAEWRSLSRRKFDEQFNLQ